MAGKASVVLGAGPVRLMPGLSSKPKDPGWGAPPSVFSELSMQLVESAPQDQVYFQAVCVCLFPGCRSCSLPPAPSLLRTDPAVKEGGGQPGWLLCNLPPSEKRGFPPAYFQQRIRDNEVLPWERHLDFCVIFQEGLGVLPRKHEVLNHGLKSYYSLEQSHGVIIGSGDE